MTTTLNPLAGKRVILGDALGFDPGDGNLYRYVGNDPTNATDPSGLAARWPPRMPYADEPPPMPHADLEAANQLIAAPVAGFQPTKDPTAGAYVATRLWWHLSEPAGPSGGAVVQFVDSNTHLWKADGTDQIVHMRFYEFWRIVPGATVTADSLLPRAQYDDELAMGIDLKKGWIRYEQTVQTTAWYVDGLNSIYFPGGGVFAALSAAQCPLGAVIGIAAQPLLFVQINNPYTGAGNGGLPSVPWSSFTQHNFDVMMATYDHTAPVVRTLTASWDKKKESLDVQLKTNP